MVEKLRILFLLIICCFYFQLFNSVIIGINGVASINKFEFYDDFRHGTEDSQSENWKNGSEEITLLCVSTFRLGLLDFESKRLKNFKHQTQRTEHPFLDSFLQPPERNL